MSTVNRQTIHPVNQSRADGRERKQCGALKGIVVDPIGCYRAMPIGETCSPSQQCAGGLRSAASALRQARCHGRGAQQQEVRLQLAALGVEWEWREGRASLIMRQLTTTPVS